MVPIPILIFHVLMLHSLYFLLSTPPIHTLHESTKHHWCSYLHYVIFLVKKHFSEIQNIAQFHFFITVWSPQAIKSSSVWVTSMSHAWFHITWIHDFSYLFLFYWNINSLRKLCLCPHVIYGARYKEDRINKGVSIVSVSAHTCSFIYLIFMPRDREWVKRKIFCYHGSVSCHTTMF
jgi:hypothetical protein